MLPQFQCFSCSLTVSLSKCWLSDRENSLHANASDPHVRGRREACKQESKHLTSASQMPCCFNRSRNMRKITTGCHRNLAHLLLKTKLYTTAYYCSTLEQFRVKARLGELMNWCSESESSMPREHNRKER